MRLLALLALLATPMPALATGPDHTAWQESRDAARLEQQELQSRIQALHRQQSTTEALLAKQQQYLETLRQQMQALRQQSHQDGLPRPRPKPPGTPP